VERATLEPLYEHFGGPDWHVKDGWLSSTNPCGDGTIGDAWYGVECTIFESGPSENSSSHVTGLVLPQNKLAGQLPLLHGLQYLRQLDFSNAGSSELAIDFDNAVSGTLNALCGLGNISTVLLADNNIIGSIPDCIQSLTNATVLNLNHNAIQGTTPISLCRLNNLEELHLQGNRLHGTVPACIGKFLTVLRLLDYSNIHTDYSIANQSLSGTLPTSLCDLERLEILMFQQTLGLDGTIPECLGARQPQLQGLGFPNNRFNSMLPPSICQAKKLEYLYMWGNSLTGTRGHFQVVWGLLTSSSRWP